jgi:hypothetical protein
LLLEFEPTLRVRNSHVPRPDFDQSHPEYVTLLNQISDEVKKMWGTRTGYNMFDPKLSEQFQSIGKRSKEYRCGLINWLVGKVLFSVHTPSGKWRDGLGHEYPVRHYYERYDAYMQMLKSLLRAKQQIPAAMIIVWFHEIRASFQNKGLRFADWPIGSMIRQIEWSAEASSLSQSEQTRLEEIVGWPEMSEEHNGYGSNLQKATDRINMLLAPAGPSHPGIVPYKKLGGDNFGITLEAELKQQKTEAVDLWHIVLNLAASATGTRPSRKFTAACKALEESHGRDKIRRLLQSWLGIAVKAANAVIPYRTAYAGQIYEYSETRFLTKHNSALVKGLVFMCAGYRDTTTIRLIGDLTERALTKIPGVGPAALATGNACISYLQNSPGLEAASRLSRLGLVVKQAYMQERVRTIVAEKARVEGVTPIQLEEMNIPDFGLVGGHRRIAFGEFSLTIEALSPGQISTRWLKADGTEQKTKPTLMSTDRTLKKRFEKTKSDIAEIKKTLTAHRDRIDRLFAEDISWPLSDHKRLYLDHGLVTVIACKLVWSLQVGNQDIEAIMIDGVWRDVSGKQVLPDQNSRVRLWHPAESAVETVLAWRQRLTVLDIRQPTKQAYREVYFLTNAERATATYSNRMASHTVKQHQFSSLCATRGWRYSLLGAFDDGRSNSIASRSYATSTLRAEFWINEVYTDTELFNDTGIWLYAGTDQIRFLGEDNQNVALESVSVRLFSEAMRDADLFVGVASVGNDPNWFDQGPTPEARDYWQYAAFGDLNGFAEVRKDVLSALLPRLKIRDVTHIEGRFLMVDGKLNTYKIHLGSTNILMEPGGRYLCIVPTSVPNARGNEIALPFEGDQRLSVLLSKAFMLAEDDKITAPDIVHQLTRQ